LTVAFHQNIKTKETAMSLPLVKITLVDPTVPERQFVFDRPRTCVVGRQYDCDIALPSDRAHREVSRHHCQLDINPPHVSVRDLNSRNGTFVNGKRLSPEGIEEEDTGSDEPGTAVLSDGDEIRIAKSLFHVHVEENQERDTADTPAFGGV
jgi:eukaryotic-like serine/threonine-protein kinase